MKSVSVTSAVCFSCEEGGVAWGKGVRGVHKDSDPTYLLSDTCVSKITLLPCVTPDCQTCVMALQMNLSVNKCKTHTHIGESRFITQSQLSMFTSRHGLRNSIKQS